MMSLNWKGKPKIRFRVFVSWLFYFQQGEVQTPLLARIANHTHTHTEAGERESKLSGCKCVYRCMCGTAGGSGWAAQIRLGEVVR